MLSPGKFPFTPKSLYELLYEYVEYIAINLTTLMNNLINLKRWQIKQKQSLENKSKVLYFWNNHTFPPLHCMIEGNYLEQHKEAEGGNLYYIDYTRKVVIYAFCIVENFPAPPTINEENWSKEVKMFLINHDMH